MLTKRDSAIKAILAYAEGGNIKSAVQAEDMGWSTFWKIVKTNPDVAEAYDFAKKTVSHAYLSKLQGMIDDDTVDPHRLRVRMDAIKWLCGVLNRQEFGDKVDISVQGQLNIFAAIAEARARVPGRDLTNVTDAQVEAISTPYLAGPADTPSVAPAIEDAHARRRRMFDD